MQKINTAGEALYTIKVRSGRTTIEAQMFAASEHDARRKGAAFCEGWYIQTGRMAVVTGVEVVS